MKFHISQHTKVKIKDPGNLATARTTSQKVLFTDEPKLQFENDGHVSLQTMHTNKSHIASLQLMPIA